MRSQQELSGRLSIGIAMVFMANIIPLPLFVLLVSRVRLFDWLPHWLDQWLTIILYPWVMHPLLSIAGFLLCLAASRAVKGTVYLFICISTNIICIFTSLSPLFLAVLPSIAEWVTGQHPLLVFWIPSLAGALFFVMFLRRVAVYLEREDLLGLVGNMVSPATWGFIFAVTSIVPFVNSLTFPITATFLIVNYALFLLLTYRTYFAVVERDTRTVDAVSDSAPGTADYART